jgi:2-hydroxycyclohexanecarboxyl-CoA dehydrogenase
MSGAARSLALAGRHALVAGGNAAIAQALAADGARVTLLGREAALLAALGAAAPQRILAVETGLDDAAELARAIGKARARFGAISILVNNADSWAQGPCVATDLTPWRDAIEARLAEVVACTEAALPDMLAADWGRVVTIAGAPGLRGFAADAAHRAAAHGLVGFTRALARLLAGTGVRANAVYAPGPATEPPPRRRAPARPRLVTGAPEPRIAAPAPTALGAPRAVALADRVRWLCGPDAADLNGAALPGEHGA